MVKYLIFCNLALRNILFELTNNPLMKSGTKCWATTISGQCMANRRNYSFVQVFCISVQVTMITTVILQPLAMYSNRYLMEQYTIILSGNFNRGLKKWLYHHIKHFVAKSISFKITDAVTGFRGSKSMRTVHFMLIVNSAAQICSVVW